MDTARALLNVARRWSRNERSGPIRDIGQHHMAERKASRACDSCRDRTMEVRLASRTNKKRETPKCTHDSSLGGGSAGSVLEHQASSKARLTRSRFARRARIRPARQRAPDIAHSDSGTAYFRSALPWTRSRSRPGLGHKQPRREDRRAAASRAARVLGRVLDQRPRAGSWVAVMVTRAPPNGTMRKTITRRG